LGFTAVLDYLAGLSGQSSDAEKAADILTRHCGFPAEQASIFRHRWRKTTPLLSSLAPGWCPPEQGYLSILRVRHAEPLMLERDG
jgi:hypothetical protein